MQSVQIVTFVLKELDQQVRKYNKLHRAQPLRSKQPPSWSRNFGPFMEPKVSLPHSKEPTIVPYPEPQRCSSHLHYLIYKTHFNIILQTLHNFSQVVSPLSYIMPQIFLHIYLQNLIFRVSFPCYFIT